MAGRGVLHARLADRQLLAELRHLALEPVGLLGEPRALGDELVEQGAGIAELGLEIGDLLAERGELAAALQHAGVGDLPLDVEGAGLHPQPLAAEERQPGVLAGEPLGVRRGAHQEGGGERARQIVGEPQGLGEGEDDRGIVDHRPGLGGAGLALDQHGGRAAGQGLREAAGALAGVEHDGVGEGAEIDVEAALPPLDSLGLAGEVDRDVDAGGGERLLQGGPALGVGALELGQDALALAGAGELVLQRPLLLGGLGLAAHRRLQQSRPPSPAPRCGCRAPTRSTPPWSATSPAPRRPA